MRRVMVGYYAALKELDDHVGELMAVLAKQGLLSDTAVIYTSDHGEQLGYHGLWWKCCMFQQSARIPLIIARPEAAFREAGRPASLVDLFPTTCGLMGLPMPSGLDGQSLERLMDVGIDEERRDFAFSEYHAHGLPCAMYLIRWRQYKYIFYTDYEAQLFDLDRDPWEDEDLAARAGTDPRAAAAIRECHGRLLRICDPYRTDERARAFQKRMKGLLGVTEEYEREWGDWVPHPEPD